MKNNLRICIGTISVLAALVTAAVANTYTVINTTDSGAGSLRQAILDANAHPNSPPSTPDTIAFAIPGIGVQTINLTSGLPVITDPVVLNGYTQPGSSVNTQAQGDNAILLIELNGSNAGGAAGLVVTAGSSRIRGLVINRFASDGLDLQTNGGNVVDGNFIGTDPTGTQGRGNSFTGLFVDGGANNLIGGSDPAARNIISRSGFSGIALGGPTAMNNRIAGNFIGTDATGKERLGNGNSGIFIGNTTVVNPGIATNNTVGGATPGAGNLISSNSSGIFLGPGTNGNKVQGNFIGTDVTGTAVLDNGNDGVGIDQASNNTIGFNANGAGLGNIIAYNGSRGVSVSDGTNPAVGNAIRGNSIFSNDGPGISLSGNANNQQTFPVITSAISAGGNVSIAGSLNSTASTMFHLEFFGNQAADGMGFFEGRRFLGSAEVTTDASGNASFSITLPYMTGSPKLTSTATDPAGNTSEFSPGFNIRGAPDQTVLARGVFLSRGGTLSTLALSGQTIAGVGTLSTNFDGPALNNRSTVAFVNKFITGSSSAAVFLKKVGSPLTVIAKPGDPAPVPGGAVFATVGLPFDDLVLNNNDDLAFIGVYTQDSGATFKMGVFLKPDGQPMVSVALFGDALPGTGGGTLCATTFGNDPIAPGIGPSSIDGPYMNDSRVVVFKTDAICGGTGNFGESAFAKRPGQPIEQAVLIGEAAPSSVGGTITSVEFGHPAITNGNVIAWHSALSGNAEREAILTRTLGGPSQVKVLTGTAAPRTAGTLSTLSAPAINQSGVIFFHADVIGDPAVTQGTFSYTSGVIGPLALQGDPMPGTSARFCDSIEEGSVSDDARFVFLNEDFGNACPPWGVFATGPGGAPLSPVALQGQAVPGTRGVFGPEEDNVFDEPLINTSGDVVFIGSVVAQAPNQLLNISTRLKVVTGENNLGIGGFIITGITPKNMIIRGIGPSLTTFGLQNVLADPTLELHTTNNMGADVVVATNDNWKINDQTQQSQEAAVLATGLAPSRDAESAILATLSPGAYTAQLRGKNGGTGIGLIEAYDLASGSNSDLANISTRGFVDTRDNVMIGGFILASNGVTNAAVVVRAIGPSMQPMVPGTLLDPTLSLHDQNGMMVAFNDDWQQDVEANQIPDNLKPGDPRESALHRTLGPGAHTAIVRGKGGTTGVGLVEVYNVVP